jgi:hypothetical protein
LADTTAAIRSIASCIVVGDPDQLSGADGKYLSLFGYAKFPFPRAPDRSIDTPELSTTVPPTVMFPPSGITIDPMLASAPSTVLARTWPFRKNTPI